MLSELICWSINTNRLITSHHIAHIFFIYVFEFYDHQDATFDIFLFFVKEIKY
jgi:hypothetical protein